ncbi:dihydropyrimidinase [Castellaniella sp.]|uniref:dihydropyrimidinase n=1 Tax=Castellaniella sp. TaxID=1955812 RepID=UPI002AFFF2AC|nr:dihydropyrimidinase [Castellaniella sp.]
MTAALTLTLRGGTVCTEHGVQHLDIGVRDGVIAAMGPQLSPGLQDIDVTGRLLLPGGIDSHCHIEQLSGMGRMAADDFYSATVSAAFGGTTTVIPFAIQRKGESLTDVVDAYAVRAQAGAVVDYAFHAIISDPCEQVLAEELPGMVARGVTSFKAYMAYDSVRLDDYQLLELLQASARHRALVMVHAENNDMIRWVTRQLLASGRRAPKYHATAHQPITESEAANRALSLAQLADAPVLLVHVAGSETVRLVRSAQILGAPVFAETCPQYLVLSREDLAANGMEGAKFCCAPPPGDAGSQAAVWAGIQDGTLAIFSSDHAPYRMDASGKLPEGEDTTFADIANGVPGLETRLPILFSEGVVRGRISIEQFARITATNHALTYGLYPKKGVLRVGSDADIAVWDPEVKVQIRHDRLHDRTGYTPYEGMVVTGWPTLTLLRGDVLTRGDQLLASAGSGQYVPCAPFQAGRIDFHRHPGATRRTGRFIEF